MIYAHQTFVDAWFDARIRSGAASSLAPLLRAALGAIWQRAGESLGRVTVTAIFQRVLVTTRRAHPAIEHVRLSDGANAIDIDEQAFMGAGSSAALRTATKVVLVELLCVFGRLSGDALTPGLYTALETRVTLAGPADAPTT